MPRTLPPPPGQEGLALRGSMVILPPSKRGAIELLLTTPRLDTRALEPQQRSRVKFLLTECQLLTTYQAHPDRVTFVVQLDAYPAILPACDRHVDYRL